MYTVLPQGFQDSLYLFARILGKDLRDFRFKKGDFFNT
jgi:hypothetical protein